MKLVLLLSLTFFCNVMAQEIELASLKGKAFLVRNKAMVPLEKNTKLMDEDLIHTRRGSFVKIKVHDSTITIGPGSYYRVRSKEKDNGADSVGQLFYGHLKATFNKKPNHKRIIKTPNASMGIRGTEILLHVTRDEKEYAERYTGKVAAIPTMTEVKKILKTEDVFTQICCLEGEIATKVRGSKAISLKTGAVVNFKGKGSDMGSTQYTEGIVRQTSKLFGFE